MSWSKLAGLTSLLALAGCAPMTFSNGGSVDFAAYPSSSVELGGPDGSERQSAYLVSELREHSGFRRVARDGAEADAASAHLLVELTVDLDDGSILLLSDEEEDSVISYSGSVSYRLFANDGHLIDAGADTVDDEATYFSAAESALDLVVLHYLRPYRL